MKAPLQWINEYTDIKDLTPHQFEAAMTMSGSKVEGVEYAGEGIKNVVVGKILEITKHPDADKLQICQMDLGEAEPVQIITGAQNVKVGDYVPVAKDDSWLPGGVHIKKTKMRGVLSNGMLCSFHELGLHQGDVPYADENGILILPKPYPVGQDIKETLGMNDYIVDFEITSNRPDCLSITGLAREAAATFRRPFNLKKPEVKNEDKTDWVDNYVSVTVEAPDLCPRYMARAVKNVKIGPSPDWMRQYLRDAGVRPINNIVDITNFVMLEYGQPMHAFDHRTIAGKQILVRRARENETIVTLDEQERKLDPSMLVICDAQKPAAVAGVMGGENSGIADDTTTVVFESANFNGTSVRLTSKKLGLRTESSGRFEKGLDKEITPLALERACELVELLGCGTVVSGRIDKNAPSEAPRKLLLRPDAINKFLGTDISVEDMIASLKSLEFIVNDDRTMIPPSFRSDIEGEADVAEEIARLYGYDKIPTTMMRGETTQGRLTKAQNTKKQLKTLLQSQGYNEIITYSFISPKWYDKVKLPEAQRRSVVITNPLGEDTSVMRTTILPSFLDALAHNYSYRNSAAALYEIGKIYLPADNADQLPQEPEVIAFGFYNSGDYYTLKGMAELILKNLRITGCDFEPETENPAFHPGRCARLMKNGQTLGTLGQIHPLIAKNFELGADVYVALLDYNALLSLADYDVSYQPLPRFPAVSRDLALVCDEAVPVAHVQRCIEASAGKLLESVTLFDVYRGAQVGEGKKSLAFSLSLRDPERTLNDQDVETVMNRVMKKLKDQMGIELRL